MFSFAVLLLYGLYLLAEDGLSAIRERKEGKQKPAEWCWDEEAALCAV